MKISSNICLLKQFKDSTFYKAQCACGDSDHEQTIEVEYVSEINSIDINLYQKAYLNIYYRYDSTWVQFKNRIYWMWKILTQGYIEVQTTFTFDSQESIEAYIDALNQGIDHIKNNQ